MLILVALRRFVCLCLGVLALSTAPGIPHALAQTAPPTHTLALRGVPVEEALEALVQATQIDLMYDPALLDDTRVFCAYRDRVAEDHLRCIVEAAGLDYYRLSSGTFVLIRDAREEAQSGQLRGRVIDATTGEPLPYAHIVLADAATGTAANGSGAFLVPELIAGPHTVVASHVGYVTAVDQVYVPASGMTNYDIVLHPEPVATAPIVIDGLTRRLPSAGLGQGEQSPHLSDTIGGYGTPDVGYQAGEVLGVTLQLPQADLSIQGGDAGEHQMRLDGVPVFDPVSLGRLLGAFSPLAIGRLTVHKAGFGAGLGSQTAGVIEAEHVLRRAPDEAVTMTVDPLSANGRVDLDYRFGGGAEGVFMAAARRSLWDVHEATALDDRLRQWNRLDPLLSAALIGEGAEDVQVANQQHRSDLAFSDLHLASRLRFSPFHQLNISAYQGRNEVEAEVVGESHVRTDDQSATDDPAVVHAFSRDAYDWTNQAAQVRHEWLMGARTFASLGVRGSRHTLHHASHLDTAEQSAFAAQDESASEDITSLFDHSLRNAPEGDRNTLSEIAAEAHVDFSASPYVYLEGSLEAKHTASRVQLENPYFAEITYRSEAWRFAGVVDARIHMGTRWTLEGGLRSTYVPSRQTVYAEPRLALRHDGLSPQLGSYAVRVAAGLYRQFIYPFDLSTVGPSAIVPRVRFWTQPDTTLAPPLAYHLSSEILLQPSPAWQVNAELYHKWHPRILALDMGALIHAEASDDVSQDVFVGTASGRVFGGGMRVAWTNDRTTASARYTYTRSVRGFPGRFDGEEVASPWAEPHRVTLDARHRFGRFWRVQMRGQGIWGRTWGFRQSYYDFLAAHSRPGQYPPYDLTQPGDHHLPPFLQVDAGIAYERPIGPAIVQVRADLLNVLGRRNVLDWSLHRPDPTVATYDTTPRTDLPRTPTFSLRVRY